jgi:hypothetical protein
MLLSWIEKIENKGRSMSKVTTSFYRFDASWQIFISNTSCTFGLIQKYEKIAPSSGGRSLLGGRCRSKLQRRARDSPKLWCVGDKAVRSKPKTGVENRNSKNTPGWFHLCALGPGSSWAIMYCGRRLMQFRIFMVFFSCFLLTHPPAVHSLECPLDIHPYGKRSVIL